jgi:hypothetical protein
MTAINKTIGLTLALAGAMALGVWIGPSLTSHASISNDIVVPASERAQSRPTAATKASLATIPATSPELGARLRPVLNEGTDLTVAADGFRSGEQFAAVAHAAHNTGVPFVVLKERVVARHESLAAAIAALNPDVNAGREANRAVIMARGDIAAVAG